MKASLFVRAGALAAAVTLLACTAAGCDSDDTSVHDASGCSDAAAVTRDELESGAPAMCEHQTLVASLQPKDDFVLPLALVRDTVVEYCFEDDNGEAHRASIVRDGATVLSFTAGEGCVPARLSPGRYGLRLRHEFLDDRVDATPDVVHTRLEARGDGTHRLLLATNACPGCDLRGKAWPYLGWYMSRGGSFISQRYGWEGNYAGAHFDRSVCDGESDASHQRGIEVTCGLGAVGKLWISVRGDRGGDDTTKSSFDGAFFDGTTLRGMGIFFGSDGCFRNPSPCFPLNQTTFKGASFRNLVLSLQPGAWFGPHAYIGGDLTDADWENTTITANKDRCAIQKAVLGGGRAVLPILGPTCEVRDSTLDVRMFAELGRRGTKEFGNRVEVSRGADLSNLSIDGTKDTFVWPLDGGGKLDLAGAKFLGATVSHVTFPCAGGGAGGDGGNLSGARFDGATLDTVALSGCNLASAIFTGATLRNVTAKTSALLEAQLDDVLVDTLDIGRSTVSNLVLKPRGAATNLSAVGVVGSLVAPNLSAPGANFTGARLPYADFSGARLGKTTDGKTVTFEGATLDGTNFTDADLDGASFFSAVGSLTSFARAKLRNGANLDGVQLFDATLDGADFSAATFKFAQVCGGSASGAILTNTDLTGTVFPDETNIYNIGGKPCRAVTSRSEVATDKDTTCPDATKYPSGCEQGDRWTPLNSPPTCCKTSTSGCVRKSTGASCSTPCDCVSLVCTAGLCG